MIVIEEDIERSFQGLFDESDASAIEEDTELIFQGPFDEPEG